MPAQNPTRATGIHGAFASGHYGVWAVGLVGAMLTAFYMFRLYLLAFRGPSRLSHEASHHLHESPPSMIVPLVVLAVLSALGGMIGPPLQEGGNAFQRWLAPVFSEHGAEHAHPVSAATEWALIAMSVAAGLIGIALAFRFYLQRPASFTRAGTTRCSRC